MVRLVADHLNEEMSYCPLCGSSKSFAQKGILDVKYYCKSCLAMWKMTKFSEWPPPMQLVSVENISGIDSVLGKLLPYSFWKDFDYEKIGISMTDDGLEIGMDIYYDESGFMLTMDKIYEIIKQKHALDQTKKLYFKTHCKLCDSESNILYLDAYSIDRRLKTIRKQIGSQAISSIFDTLSGDFVTSQLRHQKSEPLIDEMIMLFNKTKCKNCESSNMNETLIYGSFK